jgi:hypothetical protein
MERIHQISDALDEHRSLTVAARIGFLAISTTGFGV